MTNHYPWLKGSFQRPAPNQYPYVSAKQVQGQQNLSPVAASRSSYPVANPYTGDQPPDRPRVGEPGFSLGQALTQRGVMPRNVYGQYGDPAILNMIRQQLEQDLAARQHQSILAAQLASGGDPYLQAYAGTQSRLQGQGELARVLSSAQLQQAMKGKDFAAQLALLRYQMMLQEQLAKRLGGQSQLPQMAGQVVGSGLPELLKLLG